MKKIIIGNWKMNQTLAEIDSFLDSLKLSAPKIQCTYGIAPQALHLEKIISWTKINSVPLMVGAQNCSEHTHGAFTGEISASSLQDLGADFCLIGHSERRQLYGETDSLVAQKMHQAAQHFKHVVICIGETLQERENQQTESIVLKQLSALLKYKNSLKPQQLIIAYEPVWAIGTGKAASAAEAQQVHQVIAQFLEQNQLSAPILYGGSVNSENISEFLKQKNINGALVGGASLKAPSFIELCLKS